MPGKSPSQKIEELTQRVQELETTSEKQRVLTDFRLLWLEKRDTEHTKTQDELRNELSDQAAKNAAVEEKTRHLEKLSDRTWQVWLALLAAFLGLLIAYIKK